jgi:hypothetical protein
VRSKSAVHRRVPRNQRRCAACLALGGVCVPARSDGKALAPARPAACKHSTPRRGRHPLTEAVLAESLTLLWLIGSLHLTCSVLVVSSSRRPRCHLLPRGCFLAVFSKPRGGRIREGEYRRAPELCQSAPCNKGVLAPGEQGRGGRRVRATRPLAGRAAGAILSLPQRGTPWPNHRQGSLMWVWEEVGESRSRKRSWL